MPINRISGNILQDDLVRGANLSFQGNLLVIDVVNERVGINTATPGDSLEVQGNVLVGNIQIQDIGNIDMGNGWINDLADPVDAQDAATKAYVDSVISSGFTIEDDTANTTVVSGGDTLQLFGTPDQVTVEITDIDQVTFGLPANVTVTNSINAATVNASANITGNNVTSNNAVTSITVSATGNITGNNVISNNDVTTATVTASGNIAGNNLLSNNDVTTTTVTATGNVTGGNITTGGVVVATGNLSGGNLVSNNDVTTVTVTASGNITGNNLVSNNDVTTATVTATGNVAGGNITTGGVVSATGNVTGGNLVTFGGLFADTGSFTDSLTAANVLTNAISGGNIVITGTSVDFQLTSNITVSGSLIRDLGTPVASADAATKQYVDDAVSSGIHIHTPVDVETPTALPSATYAQGGFTFTVTDTVAANTVVFSTAANLQPNDQLWFSSSFDGIVANVAYFVVSAPNTSAAVLSTNYNGAPVANITANTGLSESVRVNSGIGATLTATANGALTVDGFSVSSGNRVLVYNQSTQLENGVYAVTDAGNVSAPWILTRATDSDQYIPDTNDGIDQGSYYYVRYGDTGAGESYVLTQPTGPFIIGLDAIEFTQFSASQVYSANTNAGLVLNGTIFSAKTDGDTTYFDVGGNIAVRPGANLVTPNIGDAVGNSLTLTGNGLISAANISVSGNVTAPGVVANVSGVSAAFSNSVIATQSLSAGNITATGWINAGGGNIWSSAAQVDLFASGPPNQDIYIGSATSLQTTIISPVISLDGGTAVLVNSPLSVESGGEAEIYTTASTARIFETGATTANVLTAGTNITIAATTGNTRIRNALTVGGNLTANAVTSNSSISGQTGAFSGNVTVDTVVGNIDGTTGSFSGNVTANNAVIGNAVSAQTGMFSGNVTVDTVVGNIDGTTGVFSGNVTVDTVVGNIDGTTGAFSANITANNAVIGNAVSAQIGVFSGNVTADYFIGNIQGNIDAGGANTQVQFNDDDVLAGSAGFTFDKTSNAVVVSGNVTAENFLGNLYGDQATLDSSLTVLGTTDLGNIANVTITGGANLQYIQTDGAGNLTYATPGTAANVLYVSKSGNDANDGLSLDTAKLTIAAAVAIATTNTCIFVKSGDYTEVNPIVVPTRVSIIGDNLRTVSVRPQTTNQDLFHVNQACYLTGMTFRDHVSPAAAVAFPTGGAGLIVTSPYVQNCSSITTTGCGMRVDGNLASGLKSMVTDSYTQFNQGGIGIEITNQGYAQLVSIFTICCSEGIRCSNGGTCSITNSNSSFGTYGLVADGVGPVLYTGNVISTTRSTATIGNLSVRPAVNDAFIFAGQTQYQLVRSATALVANVSVVTFEETLEATPAPNDGVSFQQISLISASSHTFEYVGTGTNILTATPRLGGIPVQANEVREVNGGRVNYTSTDQFGDFRIGGGLVIKEEAGIIEGVTFDRSLFAVMTPYILALEG